MSETSSTRNAKSLPTRDLIDAARHYLLGWRGIIVLTIVAVVVGLALNWGWLVAAGIVPVLLTALPCVAMCALGLCMNRMGGRSCSTDTSASPTSRAIRTDEAREMEPQQEGN
jgi:hypothetical protein